MVTVQNPQEGDIVLAEPKSLKGGSPPDVGGPRMAPDPPSFYSSRLPIKSCAPWSSMGAPSHHPRFEICIIPCSPTINAEEMMLANALVAMVGTHA
jgi:hypothetical protein